MVARSGFPSATDRSRRNFVLRSYSRFDVAQGRVCRSLAFAALALPRIFGLLEIPTDQIVITIACDRPDTARRTLTVAHIGTVLTIRFSTTCSDLLDRGRHSILDGGHVRTSADPYTSATLFQRVRALRPFHSIDEDLSTERRVLEGAQIIFVELPLQLLARLKARIFIVVGHGASPVMRFRMSLLQTTQPLASR